MYVLWPVETNWASEQTVSYQVEVPPGLLDPRRHRCAEGKGLGTSLALRYGSDSFDWVESRESCLTEGVNQVVLRLDVPSWKNQIGSWQFGAGPDLGQPVWNLVVKLVDNSGLPAKLSGHVFVDNLRLGRRQGIYWTDWRDLVAEEGTCRSAAAELLLRNSATSAKLDSTGCRVQGGTWTGFYFGTTITGIQEVAVSPVVPFWAAHVAGAHAWTTSDRRRFANDPDNLVITTKAFAERLRFLGPEDWPIDPDVNWQKVALRWRAVKRKYALNVGAYEDAVLKALGAE
jgi:hypothetical protein